MSRRNPLAAIQSSISNLSITDCTCPICLEILIEPVVLPCKHELCLPCFNEMTDMTNYLCPMCRMRISTWARAATNNKTLVNTDRWNQIKRAFPKEIKDRKEGKTAERLAKEIEKENAILQHISKPGEIRKEYESTLKREQERLKLEKEQEEQLSLQYIHQVILQEEHLSVPAYMDVINHTTPQLNTSQLHNLPHIQTRSQDHHIKAPTTAHSDSPNVSNPLRLKLPRINLLSNIHSTESQVQISNSVNSTFQTQQPSESSSIPKVQNETQTHLVQRRHTRASFKRNIEEARTLRKHLLTSLVELKSMSFDRRPRNGKAIKAKSNNDTTNNSNDESIINISTNTDVIDSFLTRVPSCKIKRRQSARLTNRNNSHSNENNDSFTTKLSRPVLQRRESMKNNRSRPADL